MYTLYKGLTKKLCAKIRTKVAAGGGAAIIIIGSLGGALPLLTRTAFAAGNITVCASGCNQTTIQAGINAASPGDTVTVSPGTYKEDVVVNRAISLVSASGAGNTKIVATDANATPLTFSTSGATVSGFTVTHDYTAGELSAWSSINNNGVTFGQLTSGNTLRNSIVSLNRNGVYINRSSNNVIDNTITDNRTGINTTNTINGSQITGNTISNNWTEGFVYYDQTPAIPTDFDTVTMTGNTFDGNWYTQVEIKSAASSTGTLDVTNDTFTDNPVTYTTSSSAVWNEPGFSAQRPVELGGTATKPATTYPTLRIYSSGAVVLKHTTKTLRVGANEPYTTIQSAVNDAADGDTILVDAGTYPEQVHITKALNIEGANADINPNTGTRTAESVINASGGAGIENGFYIDSAVGNVTINGFEFSGIKGPTGVASGAVLIKGAGGNANLTVEDNQFLNTGRGVNKDVNASFSALSLKDNYFKNIGVGVTPDTYSPLKVQGSCNNGCSNLSITGNTVDTTTYAAFLLFDVNGVNISNNTISNTATYAIGVGPNTATGGDTIISGNTIDKAGTSSDGAIRIKKGIFTGAIKINANTVTNSDIGVSVDGGVTATGTFDVTGNFLDTTNATGISNGSGNSLLNATDNWWGTASGPTDTNNADGSSPTTNPNGSGSIAEGAVKYGPWCTAADCSSDSNTPGVPQNIHFVQNSDNLGTSAFTNHTGSNLWFMWDASSASSGIKHYEVIGTAPGGHNLDLTIPDPNQLHRDLTGLFNQYGEGAYTFQVRAISNAGLKSAYSATGTIVYDKTAPAAPTITHPTARQWFKTTPITDSWTAVTQDVNGNPETMGHYQVAYIYDDGHSFSGSTCSGLQISGKTVSGCRDASGTSRSHVPASTAQGGVTIYVRAIDKAGNVGAWSQPVHYYYDSTAPTTTIAVANLSNGSSGYLSSSRHGNLVTVSGSASDNLALNRVYVQLINKKTDARVGHTITLIPDGKTGNWSYSFNAQNLGLADGEYYAVATATDMAGNSITTSFLDFTLDNTPPTATFTAPTPADGSSVNNDFTVGYSTADSAQLKAVWIALYKDGDTNPAVWCLRNNSASGTSATGTCTVNLPADDGTYHLRIQAEDAAGNWYSSTSTTDTYRTITVDRAAPALTGFGLSDTLIGSSDNNPTLTGSITDQTSNISSVKYALWKEVGGNPKGSVARNWTDLPAADGSFDSKAEAINQAIDVSSLPDGTYTLGVRGWDAANNKGSGGDLTFTIDRTAPAEPSPSVTPGTYTSSQLVSLSSSDSGSGPADIYYTTDGTDPNNTGNGTLYTGAIDVSSSETVKAIAYDNAGNASPILTAAYTISTLNNGSISGFTPQSLTLSTFGSAIQGGQGGLGSGTGNNNGTGSNNAGGTGGNSASGQVLGASTNTPNGSNSNSGNSNGKVKGLSTTNQNANQSANFLGLGWWWLPVVIAALLLIFGWRRRRDDDTGEAAS